MSSDRTASFPGRYNDGEAEREMPVPISLHAAYRKHLTIHARSVTEAITQGRKLRPNATMPPAGGIA